MKLETKETWLFIAIVAYVVCPFDLDFIPMLGMVDDGAVVAFGMNYFRNKAAARFKQDPNVIDAEFRVNG